MELTHSEKQLLLKVLDTFKSVTVYDGIYDEYATEERNLSVGEKIDLENVEKKIRNTKSMAPAV